MNFFFFNIYICTKFIVIFEYTFFDPSALSVRFCPSWEKEALKNRNRKYLLPCVKNKISSVAWNSFENFPFPGPSSLHQFYWGLLLTIRSIQISLYSCQSSTIDQSDFWAFIQKFCSQQRWFRAQQIFEIFGFFVFLFDTFWVFDFFLRFNRFGFGLHVFRLYPVFCLLCQYCSVSYETVILRYSHNHWDRGLEILPHSLTQASAGTSRIFWHSNRRGINLISLRVWFRSVSHVTVI